MDALRWVSLWLEDDIWHSLMCWIKWCIAAKVTLKISHSNYALTVCTYSYTCSSAQYLPGSSLCRKYNFVAVKRPWIHLIVVWLHWFSLHQCHLCPWPLSTFRLASCFFSSYFLSFHLSLFHLLLVNVMPRTFSSSSQPRICCLLPHVSFCNVAQVKLSADPLQPWCNSNNRNWRRENMSLVSYYLYYVFYKAGEGGSSPSWYDVITLHEVNFT
jgi:hypothetical protein